MIINIRGKKYNFKILVEKQLFYIKAKHKLTRSTSCINNLNIILSELGIDVNDNRFVNSFWIISQKGARKFAKIAKELLSDKSFRNYIEEKLDEDRKCGEWENIEK
jgi:hypothetical protein